MNFSVIGKSENLGFDCDYGKIDHCVSGHTVEGNEISDNIAKKGYEHLFIAWKYYFYFCIHAYEE